MAQRDEALQSFIDAAAAAYDGHVRDMEGRRSVTRIFGRLETPGEVREGEGGRLPVCAFLPKALSVDAGAESLRRMLACFQAIEPRIVWRRREDVTGTASENYPDGHANGMIVGPGGIEVRTDIWLGVTLMAPRVRYPDHNHAPEETYLVMSPGEFQHGESDWFSPGVGGSFFNPPNIRHAMRAVDRPLLAFWALRPEGRDSITPTNQQGQRS